MLVLKDGSRFSRHAEARTSWAYWAVWRSTSVQVAVATSWLVLFIALAGVLASVNPHVAPELLGSRWNTVVHLENRFLSRSLRDAGLRSLSVGRRWVALVTDRHGLMMFGKGAGVGLPRLEGAVDVAGGAREDEFLVVTQDQRVVAVDGGFGSIRDLWPQSTGPVWAGVSIADVGGSSIVANEVEPEGWLLAVRGGGLVRYLLDPEGGRKRSFQTGDLSNVPLETARIVRNGVWITVRGEGVRFGERRSLNGDAARRLDVPDVVELDADYEGTWATARAGDGRLWLFEEGAGWRGPLFGSTVDSALSSAGDVRLARLDERTAWLVTNSHLFAYDRVARLIRKVLDGRILAMETLPATSRTSGVLVGGSMGLHLLPHGSGGDGRELDSRPVEWLSLSPGAELLVYQAAGEVRAAQAPFVATRMLLAAGRWSGGQPQIAHVRAAEEGLVFITRDRGCLFYDALHRYLDCSKTSSVAGATGLLNGFESLDRGETRLFAVSDGRPYWFSPTVDSAQWISLGEVDRPLRRVLEAGGQVFGIGRDNRVYLQTSDGFRRVFQEGPVPSTTRLTGDFVAGPNRQLAFLSGDRIVRYTAANAAWSATTLHSSTIRDGGPAQVRHDGDDELVRSGNGRVWRPDGTIVFGKGSLPYDVDEVSAIAGYGADVLVGGPGGQLTRYSWTSGSWEPLHGLEPRGRVTEIQQTQHGYWARTSDGTVHSTPDPATTRWTTHEGYTDWWISSDTVWLSGPRGLAAYRIENGNLLTPPVRYGDAAGMRPFIESSVYAWQIAKGRVGFVGHVAALGILDTEADQWTVLPKVEPILPSGAIVAWYGDTEALSAAYIDDGTVSIRSWDLRPSGSLTEHRLELDGARDLAFSAGGNLWVMVSDRRLVRVSKGTWAPAEYGITLGAPAESMAEAAVRPEVRRFGLGPKQLGSVLARSPLGRARLAWVLQKDGTIGGVWERNPAGFRVPPPIWAHCADKLAIACVEGLTFDGSGRLIVSTEAGLLVRDPATLSIERWGPPTGPAQRRQPLPMVVESGRWTWRLGPNGLSVSDRQTGRLRTWTSEFNPRFQDDIVTYIGRQSGGLTLRTLDGRAWPFRSSVGRADSEVPIVEERWRESTDVLDVEYDEGRLILAAPDDGRVFEGGRFYFDAPGDIASGSGSLFMFLPGRSILQRNPQDFSRIENTWRIPDGAARSSVRLETWEGGVFLRNLAAGPSWELDLSSGTWRRVEPTEERVEAAMQAIVWKQPAARWGSPRPYRNTAPGNDPIPNWWARDRFTWDVVLCGGAIGGGRIALLTPLGIAEWHGGAWTDLHPMIGYSGCSIPRTENGVPDGLLIRGPSVPTRLVRLSGAGQVTIGPASARPLQARLIWRRAGDRIDLVQKWVEPARSVLTSEIADIPTSLLIDGGQFVFDRVGDAASGFGSGWTAFSACVPVPGERCLFARFAFDGPKPHLTDVWWTSLGVDSLRIDSNGALVALSAGMPWLGRWKRGWARLDVRGEGRVAELFRQGDSVFLDLERLRWSRRGLHHGASASPPFQASVPDYPLFSSAAGSAGLSFDVITSLASDRTRSELVLGTKAGFYTCDLRACSNSLAPLLRTTLRPAAVRHRARPV